MLYRPSAGAASSIVVAVVAVVAAAGLLLAAVAGLLPSDADQIASANTLKKIHFTQTIPSSADPSVSGAGTQQQVAFVLSPNPGTIYDGSMTFAASAPVSVLVLHAMSADDVRDATDAGLPMWTVDNQTRYAASVIGPDSDAGAIDFTGSAVALQGMGGFVATASVDGWIRGQPVPAVLQAIPVEAPEAEPRLQLSRASVPATIPMHEGMHEGAPVLYVITDASDADYASKISEAQGWNVQHAPALSSSPSSSQLPEVALQQVYVFKNGIRDGSGLYGYQPEVFSSTPADIRYSALSEVIEVGWKPGQNEIVLESVDEILKAEEAGRISFADNVIIANMPQITWPGGDGEAPVREDAEFSDDMPYGGGQITEIDTDGMTVTFVAHRGWGPDGQTTYHIVTGATPERPAKLIGVGAAPAYASLVDHSGAADLYIFENGIVGSGSLGFQAAIFGAAPGDESYTPMWRVHTVEWNDPGADAGVLENISDIAAFRDAEKLTASIARPTNSYYVINAPIVDPFQ